MKLSEQITQSLTDEERALQRASTDAAMAVWNAEEKLKAARRELSKAKKAQTAARQRWYTTDAGKRLAAAYSAEFAAEYNAKKPAA